MRQVLISDYDYTLRDHDHPEILSENLSAIKRWREAGNIFGIATGRNLSSLAYIFPDYADYADYLILNDGAEVYDGHGKIIYSNVLPAENIALIKNLLVTYDLANTSYATVCYVNGIGLPRIQHDCNKIRIWFDDPQDCDNTAVLLRQETYRNIFTITWHCEIKVNFDTREFSWISPDMCNFLEITNAGIDKSSAISKIFNENDHVVTIGDDYNDIKMLQTYNGYVMAHASRDIVKRFKPDHVVTSLHELIAILSASA